MEIVIFIIVIIVLLVFVNNRRSCNSQSPNQPQRQHFYPKINSPLRQTITNTYNTATDISTEILFGLMLPLAFWDYHITDPFLKKKYSAAFIEKQCNSDTALVYIAVIYYSYLIEYAENNNLLPLAINSAKFSKDKFFDASCIADRQISNITFDVFKSIEMEELISNKIATVLCDKVLTGIEKEPFEYQELFNDISIRASIWAKAYMGTSFNQLDLISSNVQNNKD